MTKALMKYAADPKLRNKPCKHNHIRYTGTIPCTGVRRCSMCGLTEDEINQQKNSIVKFFKRIIHG